MLIDFGGALVKALSLFRKVVQVLLLKGSEFQFHLL